VAVAVAVGMVVAELEVIVIAVAVEVIKEWFLKFSPIFLFLCFSVTSCKEDRVSVATNLAEKKKILTGIDRRVSTWSISGVPLIEVDVTYLGKSPVPPLKGSIKSYDWMERDTDFYNIRVNNLTDLPIYLEKVENIFKFGESTGPFYAEYIGSRYGDYLLPPHGSLFHRNSWVWGKGGENKMEKYFSASIDTESFSNDSSLRSLVHSSTSGKYDFQFVITLNYKR
jgi:hypothetical protein